ncbi:MAG: GNAT family N-acetyltransferase [Anaerocolumna sp.]
MVGWCNANTKLDCLKCASWQRYMAYVPLDESGNDIKVKSIFCFMIAPDMKRQGIATQLLERVCKDAVQDGFDFLETYPYKKSSYQSSDFGCFKFGNMKIKKVYRKLIVAIEDILDAE